MKKLYTGPLILLVISTTLGINWDKWFGDLPEPDFVLSDRVQRLYITPGEDALHERTLSWVSGSERAFYLDLRQDSILIKRIQAVHHVVKSGGGTTHLYHAKTGPLTEGAYTYQVVDEGVEYEGSFRIKGTNTGRQSFIYIGDIQDRWPSGTDTLVMEVQDRFPDVDAWIFGGDMIERPHDRYWALFYDAVKTLAPSTPFIPATGNHEYEMGLNTDLGDRWVHTFVLPHNGPKYREGITYYVDYPNVRIVCVDTNTYEWTIPQTNTWLQRVLTERRDSPFVIVVGHHAVHSVRKGRKNYPVHHLLGPLYESCGVDLVLQGHDHAYARDGQNPVYIVSTAAVKHYAVGDPEAHDFSTTGGRYYQHLQVTQDTLFYTAYDKGEKEPFDQFFITKK